MPESKLPWMKPTAGFADKASGVTKSPSPTASATDEPSAGRDDAHDRHPCFAVRLELPKGDAVSVMYGTLVGAPAFNPSAGISFVFEALHQARGEWKEARWVVSITGSNLRSIYEHLCLSKQRFVRVGTNGDELGEGESSLPMAGDAPDVTGISVTELPKSVTK